MLFQQRNLELSEKIEQGIYIEGNRELLNEVFSNLLSNAAKYASSGCVEVELWQQDKKCFFSVTNATENMDLDTERIWQPFYVGERSRNKELSGTGLGLSIVKKISEQFGYSVQCRMKDNKVSFQIVFPV